MGSDTFVRPPCKEVVTLQTATLRNLRRVVLCKRDAKLSLLRLKLEFKCHHYFAEKDSDCPYLLCNILRVLKYKKQLS